VVEAAALVEVLDHDLLDLEVDLELAALVVLALLLPGAEDLCRQLAPGAVAPPPLSDQLLKARQGARVVGTEATDEVVDVLPAHGWQDHLQREAAQQLLHHVVAGLIIVLDNNERPLGARGGQQGVDRIAIDSGRRARRRQPVGVVGGRRPLHRLCGAYGEAVDLEQVDLPLADHQAVVRLLGLGGVEAKEAVAKQPRPALTGAAAERRVALKLFGQPVGFPEAHAAHAVVGIGVEEGQPVGRDGEAFLEGLAVLLQPVALPSEAGDLLFPALLLLRFTLGGRRGLLAAVATVLASLLAFEPQLVRGSDLPFQLVDAARHGLQQRLKHRIDVVVWRHRPQLNEVEKDP
jgi:hypothetical protein